MGENEESSLQENSIDLEEEVVVRKRYEHDDQPKASITINYESPATEEVETIEQLEVSCKLLELLYR